VVAHLGNGASVAALRERRSVATTMGMTPLDGLMMGTRAGAIDPGVLLHLMRADGYDADRLTRLLQDESGLLGVSGLSHDMRVLLASEAPDARFAVDLFVQRLVQEVASMAASLDGIEALVFTGGIGERAGPVREAACTRLAWLGIDFDAAANRADGPRLSHPGSRVSAWVIPTDEEGVIARHTRRILSETTPGE
jgi:acetate kinase